MLRYKMEALAFFCYDLPRRLAIETRHLKIFTAVYQYRSFTKAAEKLFTSQPTISEHIHNLETHLNRKLFDRLGRSIVPTPEADMLYIRAVAVLEELALMEQEIQAVGSTISGHIILAASTIPSSFILPRLAADFRNKYPEVSFEIRSSDSAGVNTKVAQGDVLLGVTGARTRSSKLNFMPFLEDELVLAAPYPDKQKFFSRNPASLLPKDLLEIPFIMREEGSGTRKNMEMFLTKIGLRIDQLNITATLGSSTAVVEAIKEHLGISVVSNLALQDALLHKQVITIPLGSSTFHRRFFLVTPAKRSLPVHYQSFLHFLQQQHTDSLKKD